MGQLHWLDLDFDYGTGGTFLTRNVLGREHFGQPVVKWHPNIT